MTINLTKTIAFADMPRDSIVLDTLDGFFTRGAGYDMHFNISATAPIILLPRGSRRNARLELRTTTTEILSLLDSTS